MIYRKITGDEYFHLQPSEDQDNLHIIFGDGEEWWYSGGNRHRPDGPAVMYPDFPDLVTWFLHGKRYCTNKSFQEAANLTDEEMTAMILRYGDVR